MKLQFLGTTASTPDVGEDCPCYLVGESVLVDTGYFVLDGLLRGGVDISKIKYILFTHLHHDHILGLPSLLFHLIHSLHYPLENLTIIGPEKETVLAVNNAYNYLQLDRYYKDIKRPKISEAAAGDVIETEEFTIEVGKSFHNVPSLAYKFISGDGAVLSTSGDTVYNEETVEFFKGSDALIHDATLGEELISTCGHSTLKQAVRIAELSKVKTLFPVHMAVERAERVVKEYKREVGSTVDIIPPKRLKVYEIKK